MPFIPLQFSLPVAYSEGGRCVGTITIERVLLPEEIIEELRNTVKNQRNYISTLETRLNAARLENITTDKELVDRKKALEEMETQMEGLKATEDTLMKYAQELEDDLQSMKNKDEVDVESAEAVKKELAKVEGELKELREKETQLEDLDKAIEEELDTHADDTVFDDDTYDEEELRLFLELDAKSPRPLEPQTTAKFHKLVKEKEAQMLAIQKKYKCKAAPPLVH